VSAEVAEAGPDAPTPPDPHEPEPHGPGRARQVAEGMGTRVVAFVRVRPVSLALALLLVVLALASGSLTHAPSERLRDLVGAGLDPFEDRTSWLLVFGSVFFAGGPTQLVLAVVGVLALVGAAERRMGWPRTVAAYLVTAASASRCWPWDGRSARPGPSRWPPSRPSTH
jgi:phosphatidylglycerol lysyltransferase